MWILVVALIFGGLGAAIAGNKGRSQVLWFILCFLFPLVGIIVLAFMPNEKEAEAKEALQNTKVCPQCAERIQIQAKVCRYCAHEFDSSEIPTILEPIVGEDRKRLMAEHNIKWSPLKSVFIYQSKKFPTFEAAYDFAKQNNQ